MGLEQELNKISLIRLLSTIVLGGGIALGIATLNGVFDSTLSIVLGIVAGVALLAGIAGLLHAMKLTDGIEEGFHRRNFDTTTDFIRISQEVKTTEAEALKLLNPPT